jgi:hypothetical protein
MSTYGRLKLFTHDELRKATGDFATRAEVDRRQRGWLRRHLQRGHRRRREEGEDGGLPG